MRRFSLLALAAILSAPALARAERVQVFSVQGADCANCGDKIKKALKPIKGVKKADFDMQKVEVTVRLEDDVTDEIVMAAIETTGLKALPGAGKGSYLPH